MKHAVWNTLHDGVVEHLRQPDVESVEARVAIQYLTELLPGKPDAITIHLHGVTAFKWVSFESAKPPDALGESAIKRMNEIQPEILSSKLAGDTVHVLFNEGRFEVQYSSFSLSDPSGKHIDYSTLLNTAEIYWNNFGR